MIKRLFDIISSAMGLIVLSPAIFYIVFLTHRKLGSPVLFRQIRPGKDGKPFEMIKFRTMRDVIDKDGRPMPDS